MKLFDGMKTLSNDVDVDIIGARNMDEKS